MSVKIKWFGNAFFMVESGDIRLFLDPWVKDNPGSGLSVEDAVALRPTHVIVSHGHPGHFGRGDSVAIANGAKVPYISTYSVINHCLANGTLKTVNIGVYPGDKICFDNVELNTFFVEHPPEPTPSGDKAEYAEYAKWATVPGEPNCFSVIRIGGKTLLHIGDTMWSSIYERIAQDFEVDCAMLPLWGKGIVLSKEIAKDNISRIIKTVHPKHVLFHNRWDMETPAYNEFVSFIESEAISSELHPQLIHTQIEL